MHDFSLTDLTETAHTLAGDVDGYTLTGTLGDLPSDVTALDLTVAGADVAAVQSDPRCARVDDATVRCTGLPASGTVTVDVTSAATAAHEVSVTVQPAEPLRRPGPDRRHRLGGGRSRRRADAERPVPAGDAQRIDVPRSRCGSPASAPVSARSYLTLGSGTTFASVQTECARVDADRGALRRPRRRAADAGGGRRGRYPRHHRHPHGDARRRPRAGRRRQRRLDGAAGEPTTSRSASLAVTGQSLSGTTDLHTVRGTVGAIPSGSGPSRSRSPAARSTRPRTPGASASMPRTSAAPTWTSTARSTSG